MAPLGTVAPYQVLWQPPMHMMPENQVRWGGAGTAYPQSFVVSNGLPMSYNYYANIDTNTSEFGHGGSGLGGFDPGSSANSVGANSLGGASPGASSVDILRDTATTAAADFTGLQPAEEYNGGGSGSAARDGNLWEGYDINNIIESDSVLVESSFNDDNDNNELEY